MFNYLRQHGEKGQTAVLLALSMIGLLAIVGLALDGGMLYWNQRRAQNGADAAAIAGVTALADHVQGDAGCSTGSEQEVLALVQEYAAVNEVPDADTGQNVEAFYLVESASGDRVNLIYPSTGKAWRVGETGVIPCSENPIGLQVKASFPQQTFLAGIIGIAETNVTVEASAIYDERNACGDFVLLGLDDDPQAEVVKIAASNIKIKGGGVHSNGGLKIEGSASDPVSLEPGSPVECSYDSPLNKCELKDGKVIGGPDDTLPNHGAGGADPVGLNKSFYRFSDFDEGYIWDEVPESMRFKIEGDLTSHSQIENPDGTLKSGLYVVTGSVKLNQMDKYDRPWRVTIAAKGDIQFSGGFRARPVARGILFFTESNNTATGAVKVTGSDITWAGMIAAPNGDVNLSGAHIKDHSGMIVANRIDASGSDSTFRHHPNYCPPDPPKVLLIQ